MAEQYWRELPWTDQPKNPDDLIIDIMLTVPRILAQTDAAKAEPHPLKRLAGIFKSVRLCWETDSALRRWYVRVEAAAQGPMFWTKVSTLDTAADDPETGKLFPLAYRFPSFVLAQSLIFFWVCRTLVGAHLCRLYQALARVDADPRRLQLAPCTCEDVQNPSPPESEIGVETCVRHFELKKLPPLGSHRDWASHSGYEICKSAEFFLEERARGLGPSALFPALRILRFLWKALPGDWAREMVWIGDIIAKIQARGNNVARFAQTEDHFYTRGGLVSDNVLAPVSVEG